MSIGVTKPPGVTKQDIIASLGKGFLKAIKKNHDYTDIFGALASVVFAQAVNYLIASKKEVSEENLVPVLQAFLNQTGKIASQALNDSAMQAVFNIRGEAAKETNVVLL